MYHKVEQKRDKFDYAIAGIFICAIIVSFTHTIELYESAGFGVPIELLNAITEKWFGIKNFFTLALFATLAAEAAFTVGLWGLYEVYRTERTFPGWRYRWMWGMFVGGLIVIGWSNIGGTLGYNYLFGNSVKGFVLGLSVPYFVLNAVLVNFSRSQPVEVIEQPKWKKWLNTYKEIKTEIAAITEQNKQNEQVGIVQKTLDTGHEQPERTRTEQNEPEQSEQPNIEQIKQNATEQTKQPDTEQPDIEQTETTEQPISEQINLEQSEDNSEQKKKRTNLYIVKTNKTSKTEQALQYVTELIEQNKEFTVRSVAEAVGCAPSTAQTAINRAKANK